VDLYSSIQDVFNSSSTKCIKGILDQAESASKGTIEVKFYEEPFFYYFLIGALLLLGITGVIIKNRCTKTDDNDKLQLQDEDHGLKNDNKSYQNMV